jgi:hypothetical protein
LGLGSEFFVFLTCACGDGCGFTESDECQIHIS